jgi:putative hemolysin
MPGDPFDINVLPMAPMPRAALTAARPVLSWLLQLPEYRALYGRTRAAAEGPFESRALDALEIRPAVADADVSLIPARGPLLVAANHPHGMLDGLVLMTIVRRVRADVRILTNHLLSRIPELTESCFFVDPFDGPNAAARSHSGLRAAHLWVTRGGALIVFPAGEVAHTRGPAGSRIDSTWRTTIGRMALMTGARMVPAFIEGTNSPLFYAAGHVHPALRTALLARELLRKRRQSVAVRLGPARSAKDLAASGADADATTQSIRDAVERLRDCDAQPPRRNAAVGAAFRRPAFGLNSPPAREVDQLAGDCCLVESGGFQVFVAEAARIPALLGEIGRLREQTYRAVGEGTGRDHDVDRFDDRYLHLFSWDRKQQQIVGAYRIGRTDRLVATHGVEGLYTRSLFRYDERLIARLSPALELGRSFVRVEYQKHYNALLLLWKGIGQFVVRHPEYRVLFGPVSISARYSDSSHQMLMAFLEQNHLRGDLAELVEALNPCERRLPAPATIPSSVDQVNRFIAAAEADGKGIPILLRQYLKLNARLLGFNVDPDFGDALDALMMVDLATVDAAILRRYLGRDETAALLARHRPPPLHSAA